MKVSHKLILTFWLCLAKQIFTRVIKYNVATAFVFYYDAKHQMFYGGPVMFVATCS